MTIWNETGDRRYLTVNQNPSSMTKSKPSGQAKSPKPERSQEHRTRNGVSSTGVAGPVKNEYWTKPAQAFVVPEGFYWTTMRYRTEIDGLRSLAVLPVILYHAKVPGFSGGFIGVDIFFVISGYLITTILIEDLHSKRYSLLSFYERRARRILPALLFMMAVVSVIAYVILPPIELMWYGQSVLATSVFLSNFYFLLRDIDYFSGVTAEYPLLHTWSLAVEEQFYIFFPIILYFLFKTNKKSLIYAIIFISLLSFSASEYFSRSDHSFNFYMIVTRAWELGIGAICALFLYERRRKAHGGLAAFGLILVCGSVVLLDETLRFPSAYAIPPVMGSALIILAAGPSERVGALLSWRPLVWVGLASYSAYLWHQPLFAFTYFRLGPDPGLMIMLGLSALSIIFGFISLRIIEKPFRRRRGGRGSTTFVLVFSAMSLGLFAALGLAVHFSLGLPKRSAGPHLPTDYYIAAAKPIFPSRGQNGELCSSLCLVVAAPDASPRVLLVGDSHAQDIIPAMMDLAKRNDWNLDLFINTGCNYTRATEEEFGCDSALERLSQLPFETFDYVLLLNRFSGTMTSATSEFQAAAMQDYVKLAETVAYAGPQVLLFAPRVQVVSDPIRLALANRIEDQRIQENFAASSAWQAVVQSLGGQENLNILDQSAFFTSLSCGEVACFDAHTPSRHPLYRDRHHLSRLAAELLVDEIEVILSRPEGPLGRAERLQ